MSLGDRLTTLREHKGLTRDSLAEILKVSYSAISKYETNKRAPDSEMLKKIADFFNVSVDYLLGRTDVRNPDTEGIKLAKKEDFEFKNPEEALKFILKQPSMMDYGGYDLEDMSEEEIVEIANDILLTLRISIERRKSKAKEE